MRILLDTHTLLWYLEGSTKLSQTARSVIENKENNCYISMISFWEIAIKLSIGKLKLKSTIDDLKKKVEASGISILMLEFEHIAIITTIPFHHRDPFDRQLVAICLYEKMTLVSRDENFKLYGVDVKW